MAAAITTKFFPSQSSTMRDVLTGLCRLRFPTVTLKNDHYVFILSEIDVKTLQSFCSDEDVYTYVDNLFASETEGRPDHADALLQYIGDIPSQWGACPTFILDVKPTPGSKHPNQGVIVHPIPDSDFSVRLFPGDPAEQVYCLDFVRNESGHPVNSPFNFELWVGAWPRSALAWVFSIEESMGLAPEAILPGEEKFALRDGYTCLLKRKGRKDLVFTVPVRGHSVDSLSYRPIARCSTSP